MPRRFCGAAWQAARRLLTGASGGWLPPPSRRKRAGYPLGRAIGVKIGRLRPRDRRLAHKILETRFLPSANSGGWGRVVYRLCWVGPIANRPQLTKLPHNSVPCLAYTYARIQAALLMNRVGVHFSVAHPHWMIQGCCPPTCGKLMRMEGNLIGLWLLSKGFMAGLAIAVPVGPVNVLCASRTLRKGRLSGLISGFGAATADALYGAIAGFSITFLIDFLEREEFWIRVIGGLLLICIGTVYFCKPAQTVSLPGEDGAARSDYSSTLLLTLTNPTTVLSFLAVLAALGMAGHRLWWLNFLLVAGIFCGSMLWWVT